MPRPLTGIHVLYASATGTAEDVAQGLAEILVKYDANVESYGEVDDYQIARLPVDAANGHVFIFIVSTCGDGEVPSSMRKFWQFLRRSDLPPGILNDLSFAVFGLGDRGYIKFNAAARKLCTRLSDLGASLILPLGLGDDSADGGYDADFLPWKSKLIYFLTSKREEQGTEAQFLVKEPRVSVFVLNEYEEIDKLNSNHDKWRPKQANTTSKRGYFPLFEANVLCNNTITNPKFLTDEKEVRHIEFDVSDSHAEHGLLSYQAGDIIHIMPRNKPSVVDAFFKLTGWNESAIIEVKKNEAGCRFGDYVLNINTPCSLRDFVSAQLDLTATPRRRFFERLAAFAENSMEKEKLLYFGSVAGVDDLTQYAYREKRTILMSMRDFPSARPPLSHLVDIIPVVKARPFSIASSVIAPSGKIQVCASMVRYTTPLRFLRVGLCSSFFARLNVGDCVPVFLETGTSLRFNERKPAILIGPGTGVAPMRSFLSSVKELHVKRVLFFGCRSKDGDFLYEEDWKALQDSKHLSQLVTAFSRSDKSKKTYVQDKLKNYHEEIWRLLSKDEAYIYVAGSAGAMPKGVRNCLVSICNETGGLDEIESESMVRRMEIQGRLQMECW